MEPDRQSGSHEKKSSEASTESTQEPVQTGKLSHAALTDFSLEPEFDRIARLASWLLNTPIGLVTLVDSDQQIHKGAHGLPESCASWRATPFSHSLCKDVLTSGEPLIIKDIRDHLHTRQNPAIAEFGIMSYLGVPVEAPEEGGMTGALCVIDSVPRQWSSLDIEKLNDLAVSVVGEIALRRQLAESKRLSDQLERFINASPAALYIFDLIEERNVFASKSCAALIGLTPDQIKSNPQGFLRESMHPEDYERFVQYLERLRHLPDGEAVSFEYRMRRPDGSWRWILSLDIVFSRDADGSVRQVLGSAIDISERKRAEEALRESEERLDLALRGADLGTWHWNMLTDEVVYNRRWAEMLGYDSEEIEPNFSAWERLVHPEDKTRVLNAIEAHTSGHTPLFSAEHRLLTKDGRWKWVLTSGTTYRDERGRPVRTAGVHLDIDDRKRAEAAARTADQKLARILESMTEACAAMDCNWRYTFINSQWESFYGWRREDVIGRTVWEIAPQIRGTVLEEKYQFAMAKREAVRFEVVSPLVHRWIEIRMFPAADGGLSIFVLDIHKRKLAEQALHEASNRKDEFIAMLGHELRNPLAAMRNALNVCSVDECRDTLAWSKGVMDRQISHLTRLVDELLDVSRITRGMVTLKKERLDVAAVLDHALEVAQPLIAERHHRVFTHYERGVLCVEADPVRLEQVVGNLLNNAAKYTPQGGQITLEARREEIVSGRAEVVIRVSDTGQGFPRERLPQIFEPFVQGERSLARSEGGLGLGLPIVKKLTEMHGGRVKAESPGLGQGCTFTVRLPALPMPVPARIKPVAEAGKPLPHRVLVVDDMVDTVQGLARLLRRQGHTVETAEDGRIACEKAHLFAPEVVLLDIGLPGMTGYEVAQHLRHDQTCSDAVIIAITGYGQEEDRRRAMEAGFNEHLVKPIDFDRLKSLVGAAPIRGNGHSAIRPGSSNGNGA